MDGVFVPNISFGMPVIDAVKKYVKKTMDVHLMIVDPNRYISDFKKVGADVLTVHVEACPHLHRTVQAIKAEGIKVGVALNPHTPISHLDYVIADTDVVLLMSVNPGFGGQQFIESTYAKVEETKDLIIQKKQQGTNRDRWRGDFRKCYQISTVWCRCSGGREFCV